MKIRVCVLALAAGILSFAFVSCGGGGASGILAFTPGEDMTIIFGANPKPIIQSELFKRIMDEIEPAKEAWDKMVETAKDGGVDINELAVVSFVASHTEGKMIAYLVGGVDVAKFREYQEKEVERDIKEKTKDGVTYYTDEMTMNFLEMLGGLAIFSTEDILEDALDAAYKGKDKLSANEKFIAARALIDTTAAIYALAWDEIEIKGEDWRRPLADLEDDTDVVDDVVDALDNITAAGVSINIGKGISGVARIKFGDEDDAEAVAEFIEDNKEEFFEKTAPTFEMLARMVKLGVAAADIEKLADAFEAKQVGDIVEISFKEEDLDWLIDSIAEASKYAKERETQANTVENIRRLATAIEQYSMDHPDVGPPRAADIEELMNILEETEILLDRDLIKDGWGNLLIYQYDPVDFRTYTVMSYGSDGAPGPDIEPDEYGNRTLTKLEEDIIWFNGIFTQRPDTRY